MDPVAALVYLVWISLAYYPHLFIGISNRNRYSPHFFSYLKNVFGQKIAALRTDRRIHLLVKHITFLTFRPEGRHIFFLPLFDIHLDIYMGFFAVRLRGRLRPNYKTVRARAIGRVKAGIRHLFTEVQRFFLNVGSIFHAFRHQRRLSMGSSDCVFLIRRGKK